MDIDERFERKSFNALKFGALFVGVIARQYVVRAIKAYYPTTGGDQDDFFVTVGPFENDDAQFPRLTQPNALYDDPILELKGGYQISPSLEPDDIMKDLPSGNDSFGVIMLGDDRILMGAATTESGIRRLHCWLDLKTGEVMPSLSHSDFMAIRRWRITESTENSAPSTIFEFPPKTEGT